MAYADARHTQRNVSTIALVAALEAGLALAIIAGLATDFTRDPPRPPVITFDVPPPTIKPPETPPPPPRDNEWVPERPPVQADRPFDLGTAPPTDFTAKVDGIDGGEGVGEAVFPTPTPSPAPSFTPIKAKPRGKTANWVSPIDYPSSEVRLEHEGITRFRLAIDTAGKVTGCTVTESSGWPVLDATTCDKLTRRAKFEAAIDSTGAKTEGTYLGAVNWRLPED